MSEIMTVAHLKGTPGAGYMDYGRLTRSEIIKRTRELAAHEVEKWSAVLNATDTAFECRVVRGPWTQHLIEKLEP